MIGAAFALIGFCLLNLVLVPLEAMLVRLGRTEARPVAKLYWRGIAWLIGLRVERRGPPPPSPALLVANHLSWLDIVALGATVEGRFIAKHEVARWPVLGLAARAGGTVFVNRDSSRSTAATVTAMQDRFSVGDRLILFAEATSGDGYHIRPFRTPLFAAALPQGQRPAIPVIPVTIQPLRFAGLAVCRRTMPAIAWYGDMQLWSHLWTILRAGSVDLRVTFHAPVDAAAISGRKALAQHCEAIVRAGFCSASERHSLHAAASRTNGNGSGQPQG